MWAPGSRLSGRRRRGFTLLELMLVVALLAVASTGVLFALQTSERTLLARDADRLAALLESARASARGSAAAVRWQPSPGGFRLEGLPAGAPAAEGARADGSLAWLTDGVQLREGGPMLLGPEPILEPQALVLGLGEHLLRVATDGLHPFTVSAAP